MLFSTHKNIYQSHSFGLLPFFVHYEYEPAHQRTDCSLLFYQRRTTEETHRVLFPFYWHVQRGTDTSNAISDATRWVTSSNVPRNFTGSSPRVGSI